jgi:uncharacterized protein
MKPRQHQPRKMDIGAFIDSQAPLEGSSPVTGLPRVAEGLPPEVAPDAVEPVTWRAQGRLLSQRVGEPQRWLDLQAHASLPWTCQRCLQPVVLPVDIDRTIRFVADESMAAELDADMEDDVLVTSRSFDLLDLIEDELIMASPIVPRHDACPQPPKMSVSDPGVDDEDQAPEDGATDGDTDRKNPFAVLAQLKKGSTGGASGDKS